MSFFEILGTILLGPLKLVFEVIFYVANRLIGHPGLAIIVLSLIMNILVLPLYRRADAMQEDARKTDEKLKKGVDHIKKYFSGDEKMMILQTYYRQNNYSPLSVLNGSVSLLLEIPFFMAAFQFLSGLDILTGVSLGPITDLSMPDGLIVLGSLRVNLLPVLMTLINIVSCSLYLKGFPLRSKIQLYGMAGFFLVFLYNSPSCLVFYWTLNNLFSLIKNIFYKLKNPLKIIGIIASLLGLGILVYILFIYDTLGTKRKILFFVIGLALQLPLLLPILKRALPVTRAVAKPNKAVFWAGSIFLTVLVGLLIPTTFIAASPQEYVDITAFHHPMRYVLTTVCLSAGTFLVWMGVFYWLASQSGKVLFERIICILGVLALINYMFFGTELGIISPSLVYENGMIFEKAEHIKNIFVLAAVAVALCFLLTKWKKAIVPVFLIAAIAMGAMSGWNSIGIVDSVKELSQSDDQDIPNFALSKDGKNVVVLMMDRAMGIYTPYLFNEMPELEDKFSGFTYYSNTISFGGFTNVAIPALYGGYEYTPVEMNRRASERLVDKHNESLLVMPVLFSENGYDVTLMNPSYANYNWTPDLSVFAEYPEIDAYLTTGYFTDVEQKAAIVENNHRNFFCFAVMKCLPTSLQSIVYDEGNYNRVTNNVWKGSLDTSNQVTDGLSKASGGYGGFLGHYNTLCSLSQMTNITQEEKNTYLVFTNGTTHEPRLLQEPSYTPAMEIDNTAYDAAHSDRFTLNGLTLAMDDVYQLSHYQTNMAMMLRLGEWFDYLRENGVYDNTRIILVSDHGRATDHYNSMLEYYFPLLMVKDFNAKEFTTSSEFMTNADVATLSVEGLIENPINPFTGKVINNNEKFAHDQFITCTSLWDVAENNGNQFLPSQWVSVSNSNMELLQVQSFPEDEKISLTEHKRP